MAREPPKPEAEAELPPYCCAILCERQRAAAAGDTTRRIFVEQRGANADVAANTLTCWGGKREPSEAPLVCIVRECTEEMGWAPDADMLERACDL
jgi:8-oxo-dGTP pyrophosphatase MutT (NUDIX family)|eukprot:COSAG02_NODE_12107_length_1594_cov_32.557860_1_plen_95_part_00